MAKLASASGALATSCAATALQSPGVAAPGRPGQAAIDPPRA